MLAETGTKVLHNTFPFIIILTSYPRWYFTNLFCICDIWLCIPESSLTTCNNIIPHTFMENSQSFYRWSQPHNSTCTEPDFLFILWILTIYIVETFLTTCNLFSIANKTHLCSSPCTYFELRDRNNFL